MAIRFPKIRPEKNEIIQPDDLIQNLGEFVNEINGNLDSDNFQDEIHEDSFKSEAFSSIYTSRFTCGNDGSAQIFHCPDSTVAYVKRDLSNTQLAGVEIDAESDGWAIVDFNASWKWTGTGLVSAEMAAEQHQSELTANTAAGESSRLRFSPGISRADMPAGGWMGVVGNDGVVGNPSDFPEFTSVLRDHYGHSLVGLNGGNFPLGMWSDRPVDQYVIQFRITVNGNLVSESGHLFNGNWRNSVYLCGATPVVAGKNKIDAEVRVFSAFELETSRVGVGARDSDGKRGEKFSYQLRSSEVHPSPLPEYEKNGIKLSDIDGNFDKRLDTEIDKGIKCDVYDRNLLVQFRKR